MNTIVVYYSRTNTTKRVAEDIAANLHCPSEALVAQKYDSGIIGFFTAGMDAILKPKTGIKPVNHDPSAFDLVVICTPVWVGTACEPVRAYIAGHAGAFEGVAFVSTSTWSGGAVAFKEMERACGIVPRATLDLNENEVKYNKHLPRVMSFAACLQA